jgi:hypothetical protein
MIAAILPPTGCAESKRAREKMLLTLTQMILLAPVRTGDIRVTLFGEVKSQAIT